MTTYFTKHRGQWDSYKPLKQGADLEAFPLEELSKRSYLEPIKSEEFPQLSVIGSCPNQSVPEAIFHEEFVPYRLSLEKSGLFPEFYFHFKRHFSSLSPENRVYCMASFEQFKASYIGSDMSVKQSISLVEKSFEASFRQCLHPKLLKQVDSWTLSRRCVEGEFRQMLTARSDTESYLKRMNRLMKNSIHDIEPLVEFLMAYEHPDSYIWKHIRMAYDRTLGSDYQIERMEELAGKWQHEAIPLVEQIRNFAAEVRVEHEMDERRGKRNSLIVCAVLILSTVFTVLLMMIG